MQLVSSRSTKRSNYLPFIYLQKIKRPGENYFVRTILLDDFPILIFAFCGFGSDIIYNSLSILLLNCSFWCIYDYGYYENDYIAEKYERDPVLSTEYSQNKFIVKWWQPWIYAVFFCVLGIAAVGGHGADLEATWGSDEHLHSFSYYCLLWLCFLLLSRGIFYAYNCVNKQTRIWLYPLLQLTRYAGFLLIFPVNFIGVSAILGQVFARSLVYTVYRYAGDNQWPQLKDWFLRWLLFVVILSAIAFANSSIEILYSWQTIALSFWWLIRSRKQILEIVSNIELIWNT